MIKYLLKQKPRVLNCNFIEYLIIKLNFHNKKHGIIRRKKGGKFKVCVCQQKQFPAACFSNTPTSHVIPENIHIH